MADIIAKINCNSAGTYYNLVRYFKEENIVHHIYHLKEEQAYRIVIKYMDHSVDTKHISEELKKLGHNVRDIINTKHRKPKEPLKLFFVYLEPAPNNKGIYNIVQFQTLDIKIEPPQNQK